MAIATADIHVKIDPTVKKQAEKELKAAGITMSEFINLELRRIIRGGRVVTNKVIDEALPENLRINSEKELIEFLERRLDRTEKNQKYYTIDQIKDEVERGALEIV